MKISSKQLEIRSIINMEISQLKISKIRSTQKFNSQTCVKSKAIYLNIEKLIEQFIHTT